MIASYLPLISRLRTLLARAHKKSYTVTVGKLNPAKLGNFLEIECFVLVACPENSVIEAKVRDVERGRASVFHRVCRSSFAPSSRRTNSKWHYRRNLNGLENTSWTLASSR